jgi:protein-S-isoprenylcysteine O-methyltransferase Ste14
LLPLIDSQRPAAAVFAAACLVWMIPEITGVFRQMAIVSRKAALVQDHGSLFILLGLQWAGFALNFWLAWSYRTATILWQRTILFSLGILFMLLGVALRGAAIWTLGRYFTRDVAVSPDQQVVRRGPYRFIRHPAYSGTFLTMLGLGLTMTNWASLVVLLTCVFAGHYNRVRIEEQALTRTIGQPYIEYMRHTKRFIPMLF